MAKKPGGHGNGHGRAGLLHLHGRTGTQRGRTAGGKATANGNK